MPKRTKPSPLGPESDIGSQFKARRKAGPLRRLVRWLIALGLFATIAGAAAIVVVVEVVDRTPREWAPYLEFRARGHRPLIVNSTALVASILRWNDRMPEPAPFPIPPRFGAAPDRSGPTPTGRVRLASSQTELEQLFNTAQPGDVIELLPGKYVFGGYTPVIRRPGTAAEPIYFRAAHLGDVVITSTRVEAFKIAAPFWHIENLVMRGAGPWCEHALHIVGDGDHVVVRNNIFEDFNAQLKINGEGGKWPDDGLVIGNTLRDTKPRATYNPITPIDLVGASDWMVRNNVIADFVRADPAGNATYGAYFKGAGSHNTFARNIVICADHNHIGAGQRVGLSLGGGGTGRPFRRDKGHTGLEQLDSTIRDNLIVACSDDGIYLNKAAHSIIDHNTLLDTGPIDARFPETSAYVTRNLVDSIIRTRDGGTLVAHDNDSTPLLDLFIGRHPQRNRFANPEHLNLTWAHPPSPVPNPHPHKDLCGVQPGSTALPGAFQNFNRCH